MCIYALNTLAHSHTNTKLAGVDRDLGALVTQPTVVACECDTTNGTVKKTELKIRLEQTNACAQNRHTRTDRGADDK